MKYIKEYLEEVVRIAPLGEIRLADSEPIHMCDISGQEIMIDGIHTDIYVSHIDYANWIEKKYDELLNKLNNVE